MTLVNVFKSEQEAKEFMEKLIHEKGIIILNEITAEEQKQFKQFNGYNFKVLRIYPEAQGIKY